MKTRTLMAMAAAGGLALGAFGHDEHDHGHDHGQAPGVEVGAVAAKAMGLRTVRAEKRRMRSTVTLLGRIELAPDARRVAAAPVGGRISLKVGTLQTVRRGEVLFTVDAPELAVRAREIEVLERRLKVYRELGRANVELESQLQLKTAERDAALAGAEIENGVVTVRAARDGRVEALLEKDGARVAGGAAVVEIVDAGDVLFRARAVASEVRRLRDGMKAEVDGATGSLRLGLGGEDGMIPVIVLFPSGRPAKRPGERAEAVCAVDEGEVPVVAVPTACIVRVGLGPTVFVRDEHDADRFLAVRVETGMSSGGWTAVKGLPDDDDLEIVKEGAYELKLALQAEAGTKAAGHFHADGTFHEGHDEGR